MSESVITMTREEPLAQPGATVWESARAEIRWDDGEFLLSRHIRSRQHTHTLTPSASHPSVASVERLEHA